MKRCSKCKEVKPLTEFGRRPERKSGYRSACKDCLRAQNGYTKPEVYPPGMKRCADCKELRPVDQFYERGEQPGKPRAYCKECHSIRASLYHTTHKEESNQNSLDYYYTHKEQCDIYNKQYRQDHPMAFVFYCQKHRANNREKLNAGRRDYYQRNAFLERSRQAQRRVVMSVGDADYAAIWERDRGICHICHKEVDLKDLHFEHVIPISRGGLHTMENVKVSHAKCNKRKGPKLMEELMEYMQRLHSAENVFAGKLADMLGMKEEQA